MRRWWLGAVGVLLPGLLVAQAAGGPYARIAVLRPMDGKTVDFEAGYVRHLEWHRQAKDPWNWYGWSIWAGDRFRWFVYATFGHQADDFDGAVAPAEDERDNLLNVAPHVEWVENGLYEFLPGLSNGSGVPTPTARVEVTIVDLMPGGSAAFEAALRVARAPSMKESLWYRMVVGGPGPRYVRLRPRASFEAVIEGHAGQGLPDAVRSVIAETRIEVWTLRRPMSYGLDPSP